MVMRKDVDLDEDQWETVVSVHSPVVRSDENGTCYTTYAISLKSDNCCFAQPFSCVHRRYSEFVHLRNLLKWHHPNVTPPLLPPKKYFSRFSQSFINDRTEGLQKFIQGVLNTPVYLSNKAVHLFLQSENTMEEIDAEVSGDVPCPRGMTYSSSSSSAFSSDCSSDTSSDCADSIGSLNEQEQNIEAEEGFVDVDEIAQEAAELLGIDEPSTPTVCSDSVAGSEPQTPTCSDPIPILQPYLRSSLVRARSASPRMSPINQSTEPSDAAARRVSFCDKVKVAVVRDQFWNIDTRPIRSCAW